MGSGFWYSSCHYNLICHDGAHSLIGISEDSCNMNSNYKNRDKEQYYRTLAEKELVNAIVGIPWKSKHQKHVNLAKKIHFRIQMSIFRKHVTVSFSFTNRIT